MEFTSYEQMEQYFGVISKDTIADIGERMLAEVKEFVIMKLYGAYAPTSYHRTYDFLNAFKVKTLPKSSSREYGIQIYVDYAEIEAVITDKGEWNQHASSKGQNVSHLIPLWMDEGHGGLYHFDGIHVSEFIKDLLAKDKVVTAKLRKKFGAENVSMFGGVSMMGMNFNFK